MTAPNGPYPSIRWHNSLILRVVLLCGVLLICLLGSVYEITRHYFHEVVQEMEAQTQNIANTMTLYLEEHKDAKLDEVEKEMMQQFAETKVNLDKYDGATEVSPFMLERNEKGELTKVARILVPIQDGQLLMTAVITIQPQAEIVRAFKNKYLAALTVVFILALGAMIYFIMRLLRPLTDLSESCAKIMSGDLQDVKTDRNSGEVLALEYTFNKMVNSLREKERMEANLRQAQRLSAIGNLAAGVAHDIRNPLNAIKLLSSHAIDNLTEMPEADKSVKHLQTIRDEVNRLEEIVSGFLSLARERELQPEHCRMDGLLGECARLIQKDAEARGVRFVTELRAGDTALMVDPKQMTRAVLNVLINALEVCPPGGRVRLFSRLTDRNIEIEVRDDGPGMPKDVAEHAFEPYFTTKATGTGLGLSITRGIIEEHGGTISLTSTEGQGCQVLIILPLKQERS